MADPPERANPPTIVEVAGRAGVSIATVSRVVSGQGPVREETRRRVEEAIAATGWMVNPAARQLAGGGRPDEIVLAVAVADQRDFAADPHYARVLAGAYEEAARRGLSVSVHVARLGCLAALATFGTRRHLGVILVNASPEEAALIGSGGRPVVSMGTAGRAVPSVDPENGTGAGAAVEHLLAAGRRRIATIAGPASNPCARERLAAYRTRTQAAGRAGIELSTDVTRPGAAQAAGRLLQAVPDLDAIFAASDLMATAVLQVLQASGRRVPDDVAVVGFDDSPPAAMTTPALSTVHQPAERLAGLAVRTLTDGIACHPLDRRLPTHLILRSSSAA